MNEKATVEYPSHISSQRVKFRVVVGLLCISIVVIGGMLFALDVLAFSLILAIVVVAAILVGLGVYFFWPKDAPISAGNLSNQSNDDLVPEEKILNLENQVLLDNQLNNNVSEHNEISEEDENDSDLEETDDFRDNNIPVNVVMSEERSLIVIETEGIQTSSTDSTEDEIKSFKSRGVNLLKQLRDRILSNPQEGTSEFETTIKFFETESAAFNRAYRRLVRKYHPDINREERLWCEERTKEINGIYDDLEDKLSRTIRGEIIYHPDELVDINDKLYTLLKEQNKLLKRLVEIQARHIEKTQKRLDRLAKRIERDKKQMEQGIKKMRQGTEQKIRKNEEKIELLIKERNDARKDIFHVIAERGQAMVEEARVEIPRFFHNFFWKDAEPQVLSIDPELLEQADESVSQTSFPVPNLRISSEDLDT